MRRVPFLATSINDICAPGLVAVPSTSSPSPKLTTVTATPPGQTQVVIGTYALQSISSYSKLRQNITTTLSTSVTATDGTVGIETAAAVVLAGGVSWFLIGMCR